MLTTFAWTLASRSRRGLGVGLAALAVAEQPGAVDRVDVPAGAAGGLRVGVEHADAGPGQVGPVVDRLRVAGRDADDDQAPGDDPPVRPGVPVRLTSPAFDQPLDVALEREDGDVGVEPRGDRAAWAPEPLYDSSKPDVAARLGLPLVGERGQHASWNASRTTE